MSSRQSFILLLSLHLLATAFLATLATPVWGQAPPDPELRLSPPSGPGGITIAASVIGFGDDCAVRIHFDTTTNDPVAIAALQSGRGSADVSIPVDDAVGPHVVIALGLVPDAAGECTAASGKRAEAPFQVEQQRPRLSVDLDDTTPGATLQIHGSGFCGEPGCSPVTIYIDGLTASDDLTVASDGTFSGEAMVPAADPVGDDIPIVAVQTDADGNEIQAHSSFSSSNRPPTDEILPDPEDDPIPPIPIINAPEPVAALGSFIMPLMYAPSVVTDVSPEPNDPRFGGRSLGITVHPTNVDVIYVATERGGFYRSFDKGVIWNFIDSIPFPMGRDIMFDPEAPSTIIASGRYDNRVVNMGGIWRSGSGGFSWSKPASSVPSCNSGEASTWGIAIPDDATFHTNVYVATDCGLAVSGDSGQNWTHIDPCTSGDASFCNDKKPYFDVEARVVDGQVQLDVCGDEGYFRSADGGASWSSPDPDSPARRVSGGSFNPCAVATAPPDPDIVYLANYRGRQDGFCRTRLMENLMAGAPGEWLDMELEEGNCREPWVVTGAATMGASLFQVYTGDGLRMRTQTCDASVTPACQPGKDTFWMRADMGAHSDTSDVAFDHTSMDADCPFLMTNDGGIARSTNCGADWEDANEGLHALDVVTFAGTTNGGPTDLYAGTQDNGFYVTTDNAVNWIRPVGADGYHVLADRTGPARVFYRKCFGCNNFIDDPGLPDAVADMEVGFSDPPGTISTWVRAAQFGPQRYVFATQDAMDVWQVYVTTDEGSSWTQLGPDLPGSARELKASGPPASPTFYLRLKVGDNLRMYKITGPLNNTATLSLVNSGLSVPTSSWDVDPSDPNLLYASDVGNDQMMFSTNGGGSWSPDTDLTELVQRDSEFKFDSSTFGSLVMGVGFDPNIATIMLGTRTAGMFVSVTDGEAWLPVPGSELVWRAEEFFFDSDNDEIYAATRGRGIWLIDLPKADLRITKTDDTDPVIAGGDPFKYTIEVENDGPDTAYDVVVSDTLPEDVVYISDTDSCSEAPAGVLTCNLPDLLVDESLSFDLTVEVPADAVFNAGSPFTMTNTAEVTSATPDEDLNDNVASEETDVIAVADLEIESFEAVDPPSEILVGEDVEITLRKVIDNLGPSAPMNVKLTTDATASPGTTVVPSVLELEEDALALGEMREVFEVFTVSCQEFSMHSFDFANTIEPLDPLDTDPDLSNNSADLPLDIECVVPVKINIKPGSNPNSINPPRGTIPVAVLTTEAGEMGLPLAFDATTIDPLTVRFGPADLIFDELGGAFERHNRGHIEDSRELDEKTKDGDLDMVLHFRTSETGLEAGDTEACVKGQFFANGGLHKFFGCDAVRTVPAAGK